MRAAEAIRAKRRTPPWLTAGSPRWQARARAGEVGPALIGAQAAPCSSLMAICCGCRLAEPAGQRGVQNHDHAFHGINPQPPLTRQLDFCHTGQHTWERLEALAAASQRCAGEPVWPKSQ